MEFNEYLRKIRKEKGLSVRGLSKLSGVSHPYLSQLEAGKYNPKRDIISKLAKGLGVPEYSLMRKAGYIPQGETKKEEMKDRVLGMLAEEFQKEKAAAPDRFDIYKIIDYEEYDVIFEGLYRDFNEDEREAIAVTLRYILPLLENEITTPEVIREEVDKLFYRLGGK